MTRVFLFPGQGSQKVGMGSDLFDRFPQQVSEADAILGYSIRELCLEDPREELSKTQFTQPALYTVNALSFLALMEAGESKPDYCLGHSLGEYDALFASECFSFGDGLKLVKRRGELMAEAPVGAMIAVLKMPIERIQEILDEHGLDLVDVANLNSPGQVVLSGPVEAIESADKVLSEAKARVIRLNVSGAFHSRLMKGPQDQFRDAVDAMNFSAPQIPVISNVEAEPYSEGQVGELLIRQLASSVRWTESIAWILTRDPEAEFVEVGPGKVLTGLARQIKAGFQSS